MKNEIVLVVLMFIVCKFGYAQISEEVKILTPYGYVELNDTDKSIQFLTWLSQSTGVYEIDSVNTMVIAKVCNISDGALSELLGDVCIKDILNKSDVVANILIDGKIDYLEDYMTFIAWGLSIRQFAEDESESSKYTEFISALGGKYQNPRSFQLRNFLKRLKDKYLYFCNNQ